MTDRSSFIFVAQMCPKLLLFIMKFDFNMWVTRRPDLETARGGSIDTCNLGVHDRPACLAWPRHMCTYACCACAIQSRMGDSVLGRTRIQVAVPVREAPDCYPV